MGAPQLTDQVRKRLAALIAEDRPDGERLLERLRDFRAFEGVPACSAVVHLMARLSIRETEAEQLLTDVLEHRGEMVRRLSRDPGLRVAAMDYLANVRPLLRDPAVVEPGHVRREHRFALEDDRTELFHRRHARQVLDLEIQRSRRAPRSLSVVILDPDGFRSITDLYGHPFGDLVLNTLSRVLRRAVRESDVAARRGGAQFLLILPETGRLAAFMAAERVRQRVERHFARSPIGERAISLTVSGGVATHPEDGGDTAALLARAEQALQMSRIQGTNRNTIYHSERRASVRYPARPESRVSLRRPGGLSCSSARLLELSSQGALVDRGDDLQPREAVELLLPDVPTEPPRVVPGSVVRVEERGQARGRRLAISFAEPLARRILARATAGAAPVHPGESA